MLFRVFIPGIFVDIKNFCAAVSV